MKTINRVAISIFGIGILATELLNSRQARADTNCGWDSQEATVSNTETLEITGCPTTGASIEWGAQLSENCCSSNSVGSTIIWYYEPGTPNFGFSADVYVWCNGNSNWTQGTVKGPFYSWSNDGSAVETMTCGSNLMLDALAWITLEPQ
jgi:hypothetical protein